MIVAALGCGPGCACSSCSPLGQPAAPSLDDLVFVIDSIQPITGARGSTMAKLGLTVTAQAQQSAKAVQPPPAAAQQLPTITKRLQAHADATGQLDPNENYSGADALRTDLSQALSSFAQIAAPAARDRVFSDALGILNGVASSSIGPLTTTTAGTVFTVLSVVGTIIGGLATAYAVWRYSRGRGKPDIPGVFGPGLGALQIRRKRYRDRDGYTIVGKPPGAVSKVSIFARTRGGAEEIRNALKTGDHHRVDQILREGR